jgi:hypothetical protein
MPFPVSSLPSRAPRVRTTEYTPAVLRFPSGDTVTGRLEVFSATGGLLCLQKPLIRGTRIKVMFLTPQGPVLGAAEMLTPVSWTQQPFRFVSPAEKDQHAPRTASARSPKLDIPVPRAGIQIPDPEPQWIDKYRAAVSRNPPRRPLLERMMEALRPGPK